MGYLIKKIRGIIRDPQKAFYSFIIGRTSLYKHYVDSNPKRAIDMMWYISYQKPFPWDNPITLNEKINWLSGMTDTSLWTEYSDKYSVRHHIEELGLGEILTECYGIWDNVEDIDFEKLPNSFVIKCTHDCGSTILVKDKATMNTQEVKHFLKDHLNIIMGYETCEPHYTKIKPRIMAEELLHESDMNGFTSTSIVDYKIWCINGEAKWVFICYDRHLDSQGVDPKGHSTVFDIYDIKEWTPLRYYLTEEYKNVEFKKVPRPVGLDRMITVAEKLAKGFPQVRIDLYDLNGQIRFGEMTFTSQGGRMSYFTQEFQEQAGKMVVLPTI